MPRCAATTKGGKKCVKGAINGKTYCAIHSKLNADADDNTTTVTEVEDSHMDVVDDSVAVTFPGDAVLGGNPKEFVEKLDVQHTDDNEAHSNPVVASCVNEDIQKLKDEVGKLQEALKALSMNSVPKTTLDAIDTSKLTQPKPSTIETKAKWLFYQAIKGETSWYEGLRNEMRGRLIAAELIMQTDENIDWRLIKAGTDKYFTHHLAIEEKTKFMEKAYAKIMEAKAARRLQNMSTKH